MESLDTLNEKINKITKDIQTTLSKALTPENLYLVKDRKFGQRQFNLLIRLDEFTPEMLMQEFSNLKRLFNEFKTLRQKEKEMLDKFDIDKRISQDVFTL